ncbi:MAG: MFS transporter [Actinomycetota bacterium]|nr:MFS transporter [Actinomycetota bacterium]
MTSAPKAARLAVLLHFLANGIGMGVWASRLPSVKHDLGLSDGQVAVVIFAGAIAAMASLRLAGPMIERFGSRRTTQVAGTFMMLSLLMPAAAGGLVTLALGVVLIAAGSSFQDVSMNSQAVAIERRMERPTMSSFHAAFSIGGIVGAGFGALTAKLDLSYRVTFAIASAVLTVAVLLANRWLLDAPETASRDRSEVQGTRDLPHRAALLVLGAIGVASFVAEGSATDWIAIYLRDNTASSAAVAALGFMAFNVTMTVGRLFGDRLAARFGAMPLVRAGTALAGVGSAAGLLLGTTPAGIAGFSVMGLGLSIVVPQVFSAAGQLAPDRAPAALSLVSAISYLGFLAGPAAIGAVAEIANLRLALLIPAALVLVASVVASRVRVPSGAPVPAPLPTPEPVPPAAGPQL